MVVRARPARVSSASGAPRPRGDTAPGLPAESSSSGAAAASANNTSNAAGNKYVINVKQIAKFVVGLGEKVAPTDIEEGMRVGVDRSKYSIQIPLPPKIDPSVTMMTVEEKPDITYEDVGGCKEQIERLKEVVELPLLKVCLEFVLFSAIHTEFLFHS